MSGLLEGHGHSYERELSEMPRRTGMDRDAARFGAIIRRMREAKGWTLIKFGRKAHMHPTYL
ncbi:MAG TPA: helix-turn-helix transcriptional regulator, partial [Thermoanaerobaculia bacterium]|nr:helix-turn-helix transcriptional regulator [Thermoanaerobaculia bacterium]